LPVHGRGILISRFQFDEMEYIGKGNIVRVKKSSNTDLICIYGDSVRYIVSISRV